MSFKICTLQWNKKFWILFYQAVKTVLICGWIMMKLVRICELSCTNMRLLVSSIYKKMKGTQISAIAKENPKHFVYASVFYPLQKCLRYPGTVSISHTMSHGEISQTLKSIRSLFTVYKSRWNMTSARLQKCLPNFKLMWIFQHTILWIWDFMRYY